MGHTEHVIVVEPLSTLQERHTVDVEKDGRNRRHVLPSMAWRQGSFSALICDLRWIHLEIYHLNAFTVAIVSSFPVRLPSILAAACCPENQLPWHLNFFH